MSRSHRLWESGLAYHVLNRAVRRVPLFDTDADYATFESLMWQALQRVPVRLLAFSLMPNHWHFIVAPVAGADLPPFMHWLTMKHALEWHRRHDTSGTGPVYQGRYKAFALPSDHDLLRACRYVERNALAAGIVDRAEAWRWSSTWKREHRCASGFLDAWPVPIPSDWLTRLNER